VKEIKLTFKNGRMRIDADGANGKGTEAFTEKLAKKLGQIIERHKGVHHHTHGEDTHVHTGGEA